MKREQTAVNPAAAMGGRWGPRSTATLVHALLLVPAMGSTFVLGFGVVGPSLGLDMSQVFSGNRLALLTTASMGLYAVGGVVGLGLLLLGRVRPATLGWRRDHLGRDFVAGLVGVVALVIAMMLVVWMFGLELSGLLHTVTHFTAQQRAQMLLIGVIAGLGEESVFRGYLQPVLCVRMGAVAGIVAGAAIFAAYHLPVSPHPTGIAAKFMFGLVLGLMRHRTDSLVPAAIAHFGFWQVMGFA